MIETGVLFEEIHSSEKIHSFYDLNLIFAPFTPTPAKLKELYIDVDGSDEPLDLSEAHGKRFYKPRDFQFKFTISPTDGTTFDEKVTQVSNALNGKRFKITLDRDPGYYWVGRCTIDQYIQDNRIGQIVVKAKVNPYKLKQTETVSVIDFEAGRLKNHVITLESCKSVCPVIECTADNTLVVTPTGSVTLNAGTHKVLDVCFVRGKNAITIMGQTSAGRVTFRYQEGDL